MENKFILWDFDGTLAFREGLWSGTLAQILQAHHPELGLGVAEIRPFLQTGFPWHQHEVAHTHIRTADDWWREVHPIFASAFEGVGLPRERADQLAGLVRGAYVNPAYWQVYDDVLPTLHALTERGWRHAILSNHVPELAEIVEALGLSHFFERLINSAIVGYEKPHPQVFRHAVQQFGDVQTVWMVGDSVSADIRGAEAAGIPAILVRKQEAGVVRSCADLSGVLKYVDASRV